jgi:hypothetical protein
LLLLQNEILKTSLLFVENLFLVTVGGQ